RADARDLAPRLGRVAATVLSSPASWSRRIRACDSIPQRDCRRFSRRSPSAQRLLPRPSGGEFSNNEPPPSLPATGDATAIQLNCSTPADAPPPGTAADCPGGGSLTPWAARRRTLADPAAVFSPRPHASASPS